MADLLARFIPGADNELPGGLPPDAPWRVLGAVADLVRGLLGSLPPGFVRIGDEVAVHEPAVVHPSAILAGPVVAGAGRPDGGGRQCRIPAR